MELLQQLGYRVWFENSFLKSRIESETSLGKFRGNLNVALATSVPKGQPRLLEEKWHILSSE